MLDNWGDKRHYITSVRLAFVCGAGQEMILIGLTAIIG